jgi:hypothetical protein
MAVLRAAKRKRLSRKSFGLPGSRKYPMPDRRHAANAKARATQMAKRGKISAATKARIHAKANRVLRRGRKTTTRRRSTTRRRRRG